MTAYEFICADIDRTTKQSERETDGTLIALPYPYTTPCADGAFQEMYYWDTYFTHKCLLLIGKEAQAANNARNFAYLLQKYGKIPNGNRMHYLGRSQPAFFGLLLSDILAKAPGLIVLQEAFSWLEAEYAFWIKQRGTPNGLNRYACDLTDEEALGNVGYYNEIHTESYAERTGIVQENTVENGKNVIAECESGWDFSPRFHSRCMRHNPVDLNSLLYADERLLSAWARALGKEEIAKAYAQKAADRREKMQALMKREGVYYDHNFVDGGLSECLSCAAFYPYFTGVDNDAMGFKKALAALEREHGIAACLTQKDGYRYQWAEPNGWAPMHYVAVAAADRLGLKEDAKRIVDKYLNATDQIYEKTGRLWEKYNVETGTLDVSSEYGTPEMLGWSAGVYVAFYHYRKNGYNGLI